MITAPARPADQVDEAAATPSLQSLDAECRRGLKCEQERWDAALVAENCYQLRSEQYLEARPAEEDIDFNARPKRTSKITRTVVNKLAKPLYARGPTRRLKASPAADAWLQSVYGQVKINARMASANRAAILGHASAIQVEPTGDPRRPIRLILWKAHELAVFSSEGDGERPWAVAVRDRVAAGMDEVRSRIRVYSAGEVRTYLSEPFARAQPSAGRRHEPAGSAPNPYGRLPFVLVRNAPYESEFWEGGIGGALADCNLELDRELSAIAEHEDAFLNPRLFLRNVETRFRQLDRVGSFTHLRPPPGTAEGDNNVQPDAFALQPNSGVEPAWFNLKNYADMTVEELEVPLTVIRSDASTDLSGIAIVAKTLPLIEYTRERQPQFAEYEGDLAALILIVAAASYDDGEELARAAASDELEVIWPEPALPMPTPERDAADQAELDLGLTDPIEVLAKRRGITLEEAEELAEAIAKRRARWDAIMSGRDPGGEPGATQGAEPSPAPNDESEPGASDDGEAE